MKTLRVGRRDQHGFTLVELLVTLAILGLVMGAALTVYMTGDTIGQTGQNKAEAQQAARAVMLIEEELRLAGYGVPPSLTKFVNDATGSTSSTEVTFLADVANASTTLSANVASGNTTLNVESVAGVAVGDAIYLINGDPYVKLNVTSVNVAPKTIGVQAGPLAASCPQEAAVGYCFPRGAQVGRPRQIRYSWNAATQTLSKDGGDGTGLQPLATGVQNLQFRYFDTGDVEIQPVNLALQLGNIRRIQITVTAQSAAARNRGTFAMTSSVRPRNL